MKYRTLAILLCTSSAHAFEVTGTGEAFERFSNQARQQALAGARANADSLAQNQCVPKRFLYAARLGGFQETVTVRRDPDNYFFAEAAVSADFECRERNSAPETF